jgi:molybdopterin molybdotransferase
MLTFEQALERLLAGARTVQETESVPLLDAGGRVLAMPLVSTIDVPPHDNSAMDGYALRCADVPAAGVRLAVAQRIVAGSVGQRLAPGTAARIFTGAPVPDGADAIVMQELCAREHDAAGDVTINHVPHPGEWIRRRGEDIHSDAEILAAGTRLRPQEIGLAASVGVAALTVKRRLRVALFSTGDELTMPGEALPPGGIYNSNRFFLVELLRQLGCFVSDLGIIPDTLTATRAALNHAAAENDLILTSGGVSVGEEDHVRPAVAAEGRLDLWKIAIKPGKPLAFGQVGAAAFIGLPGNPVSSFITFLLLVRPFVLACQGAAQAQPRSVNLVAGFNWPKPDSRREFLRARIGADGSLELFANQSAGVLTSTVWADGLVDNPAGNAIQRGDPVRFLPFSELLG